MVIGNKGQETKDKGQGSREDEKREEKENVNPENRITEHGTRNMNYFAGMSR